MLRVEFPKEPHLLGPVRFRRLANGTTIFDAGPAIDEPEGASVSQLADAFAAASGFRIGYLVAAVKRPSFWRRASHAPVAIEDTLAQILRQLFILDGSPIWFGAHQPYVSFWRDEPPALGITSEGQGLSSFLGLARSNNVHWPAIVTRLNNLNAALAALFGQVNVARLLTDPTPPSAHERIAARKRLALLLEPDRIAPNR